MIEDEDGAKGDPHPYPPERFDPNPRIGTKKLPLNKLSGQVLFASSRDKLLRLTVCTRGIVPNSEAPLSYVNDVDKWMP